jgi:ketosteroid isomerase-like protein
MSQENVDLVTSGYDDFNRGDIQGVTARFDRDIEWIEPGGGSAPAGTVVVSAHFRGKNKSGADLDLRAEHIWQVRDGKVTRFENKVDRQAWAKGWS